MLKRHRITHAVFALLTLLAIACSGDASTRDPGQPTLVHTKDSTKNARDTNAKQAVQSIALGPKFAELAPLLSRADGLTVLSGFSAIDTFGGWRTEAQVTSVCDPAGLSNDGPVCPTMPVLLAASSRPATLLLPLEKIEQTITVSSQGSLSIYFDGKLVQNAASKPGHWTETSFSVSATKAFSRVGFKAERASRFQEAGELPPKLGDGAVIRWITYGSKAASLDSQVLQPTRAPHVDANRQQYYAINIPKNRGPLVMAFAEPRGEMNAVWIDSDGKRRPLPAMQIGPDASMSEKLKKTWTAKQDGTLGIIKLEPDMKHGLVELSLKDKTKDDGVAFANSVALHALKSDEDAATNEKKSLAPAKNVIVFLVDTLRPDKLRIYNRNSRVQTPALDAWTKTATRFTAAHTQENWTKPSVATLMTSTMPWQHNATTGEAVLPRRIPTMSELLQKEGFYTGFFSSNGYVSDKFGFGRGWNTYRNYIREGRKNPAQYVAHDVLEWLDKRPKDKRFFLYIHTIDPHVPYRPPSEFSDMYDPEPYSGVVNFRKDATLLENIKIGRLKLNQRDKQQLVALYDGEITYHDVWFGKILDGLRERGLDQNTAMVFTSDHGEEFWDHGSVGHGHNVYEELLHIPMVMHIPGAKERRTAIDTPVGLVDIAPTMFDALGVTAQGFEGTSQLQKIAGAEPLTQTIAVSGFMDNWRTIVMGDWKLIMKGNLDPRLYYLPDDPSEQTNVVDKHPMVAWNLMQHLGRELGRTAATTGRGSRKPKVEKTTIDPKTREQLRALGYIE